MQLKFNVIFALPQIKIKIRPQGMKAAYADLPYADRAMPD
jgi:hypothetical protein